MFIFYDDEIEELSEDGLYDFITDAEAKKIAAEAEAKANETLEKSITEKILKDKYIEKWTGQLPKVVSDDSSMLFNIDGADTNKGE